MNSELYLYDVDYRSWDKHDEVDSATGLLCARGEGEAINLVKQMYPGAYSIRITAFDSYRIHLSGDTYYQLRNEIEEEFEYKI